MLSVHGFIKLLLHNMTLIAGQFNTLSHLMLFCLASKRAKQRMDRAHASFLWCFFPRLLDRKKVLMRRRLSEVWVVDQQMGGR